MRRATAIRRRWASVLLTALIGACVWIVILGFFPTLPLGLLRLPWWVIPTIAFLTLAAIIVDGLGSSLGLPFLAATPAARGRWTAVLGLRHWGTYPSFWQSAILGTAAVVCFGFTFSRLPAAFDAVHQAYFYWSASLVSVLVLCLLPCAWCTREKVKKTDLPPTSAGSARNIESLSEEEFEAWLRDDQPIDDAKHDYFGTARIAERISRRLARGKGSQVVLGALGSGKTSLSMLVEQSLATTPRLLFVRVSLWEFETAPAAAHGLPEAIVEKLGEVVNILPIRGLSESYVRAIGCAGAPGSIAAQFLAAPSPHERLKKIDEVLTATDRRMVIWLEDAERFADAASGSTDGHTRGNRLRSLYSLAFGLDQLNRVSIVSATTTARDAFDFEKLARHVEQIPTLPDKTVRALLAKFRRGQLKRFPDDIDPAQVAARTPMNALDSEDLIHWRSIESNRTAIDFYLVTAIETPRVLKFALRAAVELWDDLHGEVDFDDLLAITLLRATFPAGYDVLRLNRAQLPRWGEGLYANGQDAYGNAAPRIRDLDEIDSKLGNWERNYTRAVAQFVFGSSERKGKPQSLATERYWSRFSDGRLSRTDDLDQPLLRAIRDDDEQTLVEYLVSGRGAMVENFDHLLPDEGAFSLLAPLCEQLVSVNPLSWASNDLFGGDPPGIIHLWRTWQGKLRAAPDEKLDDLLKLVVEELLAVLPRSVGNLGLLRELDYYYLAIGREGPRILDVISVEQGRALAGEVRSAMWNAMVKHYAARPDVLVDAMRDALPYSLWRVVWGSYRCEEKRFDEIPFPGWQEFAATILDAARLDPDVLAELAVFVVRETGERIKKNRTRTVHKYDRDLCIRLFDKEDVVLDLPWHLLPNETRTSDCVDAVRDELARRKNAIPIETSEPSSSDGTS